MEQKTENVYKIINREASEESEVNTEPPLLLHYLHLLHGKNLVILQVLLHIAKEFPLMI